MRCEVLVAGSDGEGPALLLERPISFWGGIDPQRGTVIDARHPQKGACITGSMLFLPGTIGSSSASAVLLELVHQGKAPAGIIMHAPDAILLLGLLAAREMGWAIPAALGLDRACFGDFAGHRLRLSGDALTVLS
jgi:uncharacterized protein